MEIVKNKWLNIAVVVVLISTAIVIALFVKEKVDEKRKDLAAATPLKN